MEAKSTKRAPRKAAPKATPAKAAAATAARARKPRALAAVPDPAPAEGTQLDPAAVAAEAHPAGADVPSLEARLSADATFAELLAALDPFFAAGLQAPAYTKLYAAFRHGRRVVCSAIPMKGGLRLVLPLPPAEFADVPGSRDVTFVGHWGSGNFEVKVAPGFDPELVRRLVARAIAEEVTA